ncbi:MAG: hypothetical protein EDQ89_07405 [Acidobacteria bacterium]|nr:MAG: hypothetical protein EDQ89_07405 [Acidobacteriota bacterium]GIK76395.1 MAG: hypothetical protein BroJett022_00850 [Actinomycetes bacterium]
MSRSAAAAIALAAFAATSAGRAAAAEWPLYDNRTWQQITVPAATGASCGNGTPFKFLFSRSVGDPTSDRVVIWMPGGGSTSIDRDGGLSSPIQSLAVLDDRLNAGAGSNTVPASGANLFLDHRANDGFIGDAQWVILPYCTQDFHSGNLTAPTTYDFTGSALANDVRRVLNGGRAGGDCGRAPTPDELRVQHHIAVLDVTGACPDATVTRLEVEIRHRGAINFEAAMPLVEQRLQAAGVDPDRMDLLLAGSSAGGFGAWYNAWRVGDSLYGRPGAGLTVVPMSGSPSDRYWDAGEGRLAFDADQLADMRHRLGQYATELPCAVAGGAYSPEEGDDCFDVTDLTSHYLDRWPGLDLSIAPVVNKEDNIGVGGFAGDPGQPGFGERLLTFCRTIHAYGDELATLPRVYPWIGWIWAQAPDRAPPRPPQRVHGFSRAGLLVPLSEPQVGPAHPAGDGMHGVLAYINSVAAGTASARLRPMIDRRLSLVWNLDDPASGQDPDFSGDWGGANPPEPACNVTPPDAGPKGRVSVERVVHHRRRGTATLVLGVPGPGRVRLGGEGVRARARAVHVRRPRFGVRPRGRLRRRIDRGRAVRVTVRVRYRAGDGAKSSLTERIRLTRRR